MHLIQFRLNMLSHWRYEIDKSIKNIDLKAHKNLKKLQIGCMSISFLCKQKKKDGDIKSRRLFVDANGPKYLISKYLSKSRSNGPRRRLQIN